jgi:hypothetical protein
MRRPGAMLHINDRGDMPAITATFSSKYGPPYKRPKKFAVLALKNNDF